MKAFSMKIVSMIILLVLLLQPAAAEIVDVASAFDQEEIPAAIEAEYRGNSIWQIKGMNRLVEVMSEPVPQEAVDRVQQWNEVLDGMNPRLPVYLYFVDDSRTHPLALEFPEDTPLYDYLKANLHVDACDHLKYSSFAQYCSYYYSTDHHWSFRGSYQGYADVVRMLLGEEEPLLVPTGIQVTNAVFNGSRAKYIKDAVSTQKFAFYLFDGYPEYKSVIDGKSKRYGNRKNYMENKYSKQKYASHYASFYGGNFGLIEMQSKEPGVEKNLLIIGDSFCNALLAMLTKHYKTVVFVDLRHYRQSTRKEFSMSGVTQKYKIDQVLFLGAYPLFRYPEFRPIMP